MILLWYILCLF